MNSKHRMDGQTRFENEIQLFSTLCALTVNDTNDSNAIIARISGEQSESEPESEELDSQLPSQPLATADMMLYIDRIKGTALVKGNGELYTKISECLMVIEADITACIG